MRTYLIIRGAVLVSSLMLIASFPAISAQAAQSSSGGAMAATSAGQREVVAPSAIEDTLKACLARIPKVASAGQRMLAEQSCQQDEGARKMVQAAPKF